MVYTKVNFHYPNNLSRLSPPAALPNLHPMPGRHTSICSRNIPATPSWRQEAEDSTESLSVPGLSSSGGWWRRSTDANCMMGKTKVMHTFNYNLHFFTSVICFFVSFSSPAFRRIILFSGTSPSRDCRPETLEKKHNALFTLRGVVDEIASKTPSHLIQRCHSQEAPSNVPPLPSVTCDHLPTIVPNHKTAQRRELGENALEKGHCI